MLKYKTFQTPSSGANDLNGRIYDSNQQPAHKSVIITHGMGATMRQDLKLVPALCKAGFQVYLFDFRSSNRTGILTKEHDLKSVVHYAKKTFHGKTLDLVGYSLGGLIAALVANDLPRLINKLALLCPAFCIPHDTRNGSQEINGVSLPSQFVRDAKQLDPWKQIRHYRRPVLICHGNRDQVVNIGYAEKAHSTYKNSKLVTIKNGDHDFHHGFQPALDALVKFLKMQI